MSYGFGFGPGRRARQPISGGTAPLEVGAEAFQLSDDFNSPTGTGSIAARPNWETPDGNFIQSTEVSGFDGDGILYLAEGEYSPVHALFGTSSDGLVGAQQVIISHLTGDNAVGTGESYNPGYMAIQIGHIDADNQNWLQLQGVFNRIVFYTQDETIGGGAETQRLAFQAANTLDIGARPEVQVDWTPNNTVRVYVDKEPLIANINYTNKLPDVDITGWISAGNRKGRTGFWQTNRPTPLATFIGLRQDDAVYHDFANSDRGVGHLVVGGNTGQPRIEGDYFGMPVKWIMRWFEAADPMGAPYAWPGANADGWKEVTPTEVTVPSGGAPGHVKFDPVIEDGNRIAEYGFMRADGSYVSTYAGSIIVGRKVLFHGQSNARARWGTVLTSGITGGALSGVQADTYVQNTGGAGGVVFGGAYPLGYIMTGKDTLGYLGSVRTWHFTNTAAGLSGEPCIAICTGSDGQSIGYISEGGVGWDDMLAFLGSYKGVVEDVIIDQGENEMWSDAVSAATKTALWASTFLNGIVAPMREMWGEDVRFYISIAGALASADVPSPGPEDWDVLNVNVNALRLAQLGICYGYGQTSDANVRLSSWRTLLTHDADGGHHANDADGYARVLERDAHSVEFARGNASHDGTGPRILDAVTRSGAVINVPLDLNGAVSLTADTIASTGTSPSNRTGTVNGWFVATDAAPTVPLTISGIAAGADGESIDLTLDADPGAVCRVSHCFGAQFIDTTLVCGYYSAAGDDRPIPIQPSLDVANGRSYFLTAS